MKCDARWCDRPAIYFYRKDQQLYPKCGNHCLHKNNGPYTSFGDSGKTMRAEHEARLISEAEFLVALVMDS